MQTEAEVEAKIAAWEAEKQRRDEQHAQRMRVEAARNKEAAAKEYAEKAQREQDEKVAAGLVEVRVDPGRSWTLQWFYDFVAHRVPDLQPEYLDPGLGILAILRAVDLLTIKRQAGMQVTNAAGFVVAEARRAMAKRGGPTTWVDAATARQMPHLIVRRHGESFAGRVSARWAQRQRLARGDEQRRALGLLPLWAVEKKQGKDT